VGTDARQRQPPSADGLAQPSRAPTARHRVRPHYESAVAMPPGPVLARGTSRAWRLKTLLISPLLAIGAFFGGAETSLELGAAFAVLLMLGALAYNAFLLATDGTFIVEPRRLRLRMRAGLEQAWFFEPGLASSWTGNDVTFATLKKLRPASNADELCELFDQLCDPALHRELQPDVACASATLQEKGVERRGVAVLLPTGAWFVDDHDGELLLGMLVGRHPVGLPIAASAVAELVPQLPAKTLEQALGALATKHKAVRFGDFSFAADPKDEGLLLELRHQSDRLQVSVTANDVETVQQLGTTWRATFAPLS